MESFDERRRARHIALLSPARPLPTAMTARELTELGRYPHTPWSGRLSGDDRRAVEHALDAVGALALAERRLSELSDGERQKVGLARILAQDPQLLLLDEVTAFLDLPRRLEVQRLLARLTRDEDRAVLFSTHDLDFALRCADRLWLLPEGGPILSGTPDELVRQQAFEPPPGRVGDHRQAKDSRSASMTICPAPSAGRMS